MGTKGSKFNTILRIFSICTVILMLVVASVKMVLWISEPTNQDILEAWLKQIGMLGWFITVIMQILQIIIAVIPAEPIQIMSGTLYGVSGGLVLNVIGSIIGSTIVFIIGSRLGKPFLYKIIGKEKVDSIQFLHQPQKLEFLLLVIMLIPTAPKDILSYLSGLSSIKLGRFLLITTLARIPNNLMFTMIGNSIKQGDWIIAFSISVAMVVIGFIGIRIQDRLPGLRKQKPCKKILLSEGSSLTSRETLTALEKSGYTIDILSSAKLPLASFSKHRHKIIATANINETPLTYLEQASSILLKDEYQTLIPTHESAWILSEGRSLLPENANVPVASAESFAMVQGKIAFAELAATLKIPHPEWHILHEHEKINFETPFWIKSDYGTAGRSVVKVHNPPETQKCMKHLADKNNRLIVQKNISGTYGQVQAVFNNGRMIAVHTSIQIGYGAGGSAAARISVDYPETRNHIQKVGRHLNWHGCLTLDFIYKGGTPYYIECNPRMIEPANAARAGVNFPLLLIAVAKGDDIPDKLIVGKEGVKTHSTMALLLGAAEKKSNRRGLLKIFLNSMLCKGDFAGSSEVLTPVKKDFPSIIPLIVTLLRLLIKPGKVSSITENTVQEYCVLPDTVEKMKNQIDKKSSHSFT